MESWLSGRKRLTANEVGSKSPRGFESLTLRKFSKGFSEPKLWPGRGAVCSAFPPKNSESERIFHAPRGSKSTVRSKILKFEPTFLNSPRKTSGDSPVFHFHFFFYI